jgi:hypothetical protein
MADVRYTIDLDNKGALRSLDQLKSAVAGFAGALAGAFSVREIAMLSSSFEDLRTSLTILYRSAETGNAVFEDIKRLASSTVFSVEDLTATVIQLKAAGIDPTISRLRLFADVSAVTADKVGALQAITALYSRTTAGGLGVEELERLGDRGIPVYDILAQKLGIARNQITEYGRSAEGARIIIKALEDGLQETFGGASAERAKNLSQAFSNLGDEFGNFADTIGRAGLNEALVTLIAGIKNVMQALTPLFALIAIFLNLLVQIGAYIATLVGKFKPLADAVSAFVATLAIGALVSFVSNLLKVGAAARVAAAGMAAFNLVVSKNPLVMFATGLALAVGALGFLKGPLRELGIISDDVGKSEGFKVLQEGELGAGTEDLREKLKALNEQLNKFRVEMNASVDSFARYNENARLALNLETSLLGTSREVQAQRRNELDINNRLAQEVAKLTEQKAKLTAEEVKQGRGKIIDATIKKLQDQAKADIAAGAAAISSSEAGQQADSLRLFGLKSQEDTQRNIRKIQDDIATSTMGTMAKKEYEILAAVRERVESEIEAEQVRRGSLLTDQEKEQYRKKALIGVDKQVAKERELFKSSRSFSTGWQKAFNEYVENATNAATQAQRVFGAFTQGLEDALYKFFTTGKMGWKDFANTVIQEMMRIQVRQLAANLMGGGGGGRSGGGGGLFGGSIIPGFLASGGPANANKPYIVGERGPELFVPRSTGTVVPNDQLGMGGGASVTYNINAVDAMSFKQMIAQDPSFLYAVSEQGRRRLPGGR